MGRPQVPRGPVPAPDRWSSCWTTCSGRAEPARPRGSRSPTGAGTRRSSWMLHGEAGSAGHAGRTGAAGSSTRPRSRWSLCRPRRPSGSSTTWSAASTVPRERGSSIGRRGQPAVRRGDGGDAGGRRRDPSRGRSLGRGDGSRTGLGPRRRSRRCWRRVWIGWMTRSARCSGAPRWSDRSSTWGRSASSVPRASGTTPAGWSSSWSPRPGPSRRVRPGW